MYAARARIALEWESRCEFVDIPLRWIVHLLPAHLQGPDHEYPVRMTAPNFILVLMFSIILARRFLVQIPHFQTTALFTSKVMYPASIFDGSFTSYSLTSYTFDSGKRFRKSLLLATEASIGEPLSHLIK